MDVALVYRQPAAGVGHIYGQRGLVRLGQKLGELFGLSYSRTFLVAPLSLILTYCACSMPIVLIIDLVNLY